MAEALIDIWFELWWSDAGGWWSCTSVLPSISGSLALKAHRTLLSSSGGRIFPFLCFLRNPLFSCNVGRIQL